MTIHAHDIKKIAMRAFSVFACAGIFWATGPLVFSFGLLDFSLTDAGVDIKGGWQQYAEPAWVDVPVQLEVASLIGVSQDPDKGAVNGTGIGVYFFDGGGSKDEEMIGDIRVPTGWAEGTPIVCELGWAPTNGSPGNVRWCLKSMIANQGATLAAVSESCALTPTGASSWAHRSSEFSIPMTGRVFGAGGFLHLYRNATNALDTYDNQDVAKGTFACKVQINTRGSRATNEK
jgi:hypothetical protein